MNIYNYPGRNQWPEIMSRPVFDHSGLSETVGLLLDDIKARGDQALREYELKFDGVELSEFLVTDEDFVRAETILDQNLKKSIDKAAENIRIFHDSQRMTELRIETSPGVICWQKAIGIDKVGLYVPGGTAPLFSTVLMLAIPACIAGCRERILCTPPDKEGNIHPAILYAARKAEVTAIYKLGGVQAIGAMAFGTETVPKVYKIFGPGNQYVTMAKQLVSLKDVAIDMPAGPSEVEVIADKSADPAFVAADFLSQAEHGVDSQSILVTDDEAFVPLFIDEVERQLELLPRKEFARRSLQHSKVIVLKNSSEMMDFTNEYAPEHLIIQTADYSELAQQVRNAGSVFLGPYTPESAGDYASGTNHTLPTNGYAKSYSGVNLDSFTRKITFQEISASGLLHLGETIETMAEGESLEAHKRAVTVRCHSLTTKSKIQ
ncbi:MAG: histidinol dehydrogenase [Bacteroidales bacterium]